MCRQISTCDNGSKNLKQHNWTTKQHINPGFHERAKRRDRLTLIQWRGAQPRMGRHHIRHCRTSIQVYMRWWRMREQQRNNRWQREKSPKRPDHQIIYNWPATLSSSWPLRARAILITASLKIWESVSH